MPAAMTESVTVSDRALARIGDILKTEPAGTMLRVSVEGGGGSGFQYKFDMEQAKAADDLVIARDGAVVQIDPVSVGFMAGSEIDFVEDLIGASFKVKNPQAKTSCGCGTCFALLLRTLLVSSRRSLAKRDKTTQLSPIVAAGRRACRHVD